MRMVKDQGSQDAVGYMVSRVCGTGEHCRGGTDTMDEHEASNAYMPGISALRHAGEEDGILKDSRII